MKVWNICNKKLGGEMKSVNENYLFQRSTWNLPKVTPISKNLWEIFREKQYTATVYSYIA